MFASWMFSPAMLLAGVIAVSAPIIIHLLNKRRFRIVDWAAMDFLFDADKKNRRRIRLENLILLLLRCLAMLLLGLMLARPFLPSDLIGRFGQAQEYRRVLVLDDSLSQQVLVGIRPAFDEAKEKVQQLLQMFASDRNSDYFTLFLTSQPEDPVIRNEAVTPSSVESLLENIENLECTDVAANYSQTLQDVQNYIEGNRSTANTVVYVLTDMRKRDWQDVTVADPLNAPNKLLGQIGESVENVYVVDAGSKLDDNLTISDINAEDLLVANSIVRFNVSVTNYGKLTAENVEVEFRVDDAQAQTTRIPTIAPGQTQTVTFPFRFHLDADEFGELEFQDRLVANRRNHRITAKITQDGKIRDHLAGDSTEFFAARTLNGIPVLIVDGDPSAVPERSESYYLRSIGVTDTGLLIDTATVGELETVSLTKYEVIFLCNVDETTTDRITSLQQWVKEGGGLVLMPGDQVRARTFNQTFYQDGEGLSPLELQTVQGDANKHDWVYMEVTNPNYPPLAVTLDEDVAVGKVEVFSWWHSKVHPDQIDKTVSVPVRLSNAENSPLMAEKTVGKGKVIAFAIPADADWTMWPSDVSFVCVMWDLVNHLAGNMTQSEKVMTGGDMVEIVDLSRYDLEVDLIRDRSEAKRKATAQSVESSDEGKNSVLYQVRFDKLLHNDFYQMIFAREDGENEAILTAVNVDASEGDLSRLDIDALPADYFGESAEIIAADELVLSKDTDSNNEIWMQVLFILGAVLATEQILAWWFGRRR